MSILVWFKGTSEILTGPIKGRIPDGIALNGIMREFPFFERT